VSGRVVLLHGGGSTGATWHALATRLVAAGFEAVTPDLRGHGAGPRPGTYPLAGFAADVLALLESLGPEPVDLIGHSLGGYVALAVATARPDRVRRLVVEDPPVPPRTGPSTRQLSRLQMSAGFVAALARGRWFDPRALRSVLDELRRPDPEWWAGLGTVTVPTLVVSGGEASHIAPTRLAELTSRLPDARLLTIPVGHRVHSHAPDRFAEVVLSFLAG
jgi:pimeloyl-ACP methyl ester carboxylesterase